MSIKLMAAVWPLNLRVSEKLVLLALADNANDEGYCWPLISTLMAKCSLSERAIQQAISDLAKADHLSIERRQGRSNYYSIHPSTSCTPQDLHPAANAPTPANGAPHPPQTPHPPPPFPAPITIIEPSVEPPKNRQRAREGLKVSRGADTPEWFLDFKLAYPERNGDPNWRGALSAARARMAEGHTPAEFLSGARRYAAYQEAVGKVGTEFVQQASRFLGPGKPFLLAWKPPPKAESASERILRTLEGNDSRVIEHESDRTSTRAISRQ